MDKRLGAIIAAIRAAEGLEAEQAVVIVDLTTNDAATEQTDAGDRPDISSLARAEASLGSQGLDRATSDQIRRTMAAAGSVFGGDSGWGPAGRHGTVNRR